MYSATNKLNKKYMNKANIVASIVEGETYCYFSQLLENNKFKKLFFNLIKQNASINEITKKLITLSEKEELV